MRPGDKHYFQGWAARSRWEVNGYSSAANKQVNTLNWDDACKAEAQHQYRWAGLIKPEPVSSPSCCYCPALANHTGVSETPDTRHTTAIWETNNDSTAK